MFPYLQMSMFRMRLVYYTGLGGIGWYSMATPEDCDHQLLAHSERIGEARVWEGMDWSVATEGEPVAGDVGEQCSRVEVVEDDAEVEGPAAYGGDDAA